MERRKTARLKASTELKTTAVGNDDWIVQFEEDGVIFKCSLRSIKPSGPTLPLIGQKVSCKWKNGKYYNASVLETGSSPPIARRKVLATKIEEKAIDKSKIFAPSIEKNAIDNSQALATGFEENAIHKSKVFATMIEKNEIDKSQDPPTGIDKNQSLDKEVLATVIVENSIDESEKALALDISTGENVQCQIWPEMSDLTTNACNSHASLLSTDLAPSTNTLDTSDSNVSNDETDSSDSDYISKRLKINKLFPDSGNENKNSKSGKVARYEPKNDKILTDKSTCEQDDSDILNDSFIDPDFVPDSASSIMSSSDEELDILPVLKKKSKKCTKIDSSEHTDFDGADTINVCHSNNAEKRKWDKSHYCVYCDKPFSKLARHLLRKHKTETDVIEIMGHNPGSPKRKALITKLTNKGDFNQNCKIISQRSGNIIVKKRPSSKCNDDYRDFLPCKFCFGMFKKHSLWRHVKTCLFKRENDNAFPKKKQHQRNGESLLPVCVQTSFKMKTELLSVMQSDKITLCVKNDPLILRFGEGLFHKFGKNKHQHQHVSQKMRELARLVLELRNKNPKVNNLKDAIRPDMFDMVISAVRDVTGYDDTEYNFDRPSLALKLGHTLRKIANILECEGLKEGNTELSTNAANFSKLCEKEWHRSISAGALQNMNELKRNKYLLLPVTEDIVKMTQHLEQAIEENLKALKKEPTLKVWGTLCQLILTKVIMFNRRREGEASRIQLSDYQKITNENAPSDMVKFLSTCEQQALSTYYRLEVPGKRDRTVPLLMTIKVKQATDELNSSRQSVGVNPNNKFVFARACPFSLCSYRGSDCLRKFAINSQVGNVKSITSTNLRKQIATVSQIMDLQENELEQLSSFMGHHIKVHRDFYRLPQRTLQVAKVSKVLHLIEKGQLETLAGKNLTDLQVDYYESINDDENVEDQVATEETSESDYEEQEITAGTSEDQDESGSGLSIPKDKPVDVKKGHPQTPIVPLTLFKNARTETGSGLPKSKPVNVKKVHPQAPVVPSTLPKNGRTETGSVPQRTPWTEDEIEAVMSSDLKTYIKQMKIPGLGVCQECKNNNPMELERRTVRNIKDFVRNRITAKVRRLGKF